MNQVGTNTDTEIYNNPQGLSASFLSPFHTHREISLTYAQKHASLRDTPHRLFSSFLPRIHRTLYVRQITTRTRCSARCLTFCNKLYGKRTTTKRLDILHGYVMPESARSTLTSPGRQIDNIPTQHWHAEKAMAPHSSTLAQKIPWMEEPGGLQPWGH